ncbi:TRAP transporter substrate-binding protein [Verticiella sediminum]|uniref:TRAP transporter substrate-binding protein n=1 Tax=Verticiella sediminum TaxID=1247510 RepID=A0A556AL54_9BURK|nr:TRAP transporter substrate-binding protein [Verticiella sediminum]TSH93627.1 TRAP transporter substrate-binding protein [Verticiella sediminum]
MRHQPTALAALLSFLLAGTALAQDFPAGPGIRIAAITQSSPAIPQYTQVDQPLLRDGLQAASNGRIQVSLASWPERNVNGPEVLRLVRSGQVEIAAAALTVVSGDVPLLDGGDLAGMNLTIEQARKVSDAIKPAANQSLERLGVKILALYPFSGQMLFCNKPVSGLNSLKGLKVRGNGPSAADLITALGGTPVSVAFGEVYSALELHTVDCALTGSGSGNGMKWNEVATHLVAQPVSWSTAGYFVNLAWWNRQAPETQALLERTFAEIEARQWALGAIATQDGIDCNVGRADGCKLHTLGRKPMTEVTSSEDTLPALHKAVAEAVLPNWIKRCGPNCAEVYASTLAPITGISYVQP